MSMSTTSIVHAWSLDDFVALSEEIAALSRAGIPLSEGLADLSQDLPRPLAQSVQEIGRRLAQGETLDQVLAIADDSVI